MDIQTNQNIGIILLCLLFLFWFYFSSPDWNTNEKPPKKVQASFMDLFKPVKYSSEHKEKQFQLETKDTIYTLSSKGASIRQAILKNHVSYPKNSSEPVKLFYPEKNGMVWYLPRKGTDKLFDTSETNFEKIEKKARQVSFKHYISGSDWIQITYTVRNELLCIFIKLEGKDWDKDRLTDFRWYNTPCNQEKHFTKSIEKVYISYGDSKGYYNYINAKSNLDKKEQETGKKLPNTTWISFHIPYFQQSLITGSKPLDTTIGIEEIEQKNTSLNTDQSLKKMALKVDFPTQDLQKGYEIVYYTGPSAPEVIENIAKAYPNTHFGYDYYFGPSFLGTINKMVLHPLFGFIYDWAGDVIVALFLLLLLLSAFSFFFSHKAYIYQIKMRIAKPFIDAIKTKKSNSASLEQSQFYSKVGMNPIYTALSGLFSVLLFICMYSLLKYNLAFRQASFWWVDDLSTYDDIISLPFYIPILGDHISLLAALAVLVPKLISYVGKKPDLTPTNPYNAWLQYLSPFLMLWVFNFRIASIILGRLFIVLLETVQRFCSRMLLNIPRIESEVLTQAQQTDTKVTPPRTQARLERRLFKKK